MGPMPVTVAERGPSGARWTSGTSTLTRPRRGTLAGLGVRIDAIQAAGIAPAADIRTTTEVACAIEDHAAAEAYGRLRQGIAETRFPSRLLIGVGVVPTHDYRTAVFPPDPGMGDTDRSAAVCHGRQRARSIPVNRIRAEAEDLGIGLDMVPLTRVGAAAAHRAGPLRAAVAVLAWVGVQVVCKQTINAVLFDGFVRSILIEPKERTFTRCRACIGLYIDDVRIRTRLRNRSRLLLVLGAGARHGLVRGLGCAGEGRPCKEA
jgi:hypothetical protein